MEVCQRCGHEGEDRRTLEMACFYAMHELGLPFGMHSIHGEWCQKTGEKEENWGTVFEFENPQHRIPPQHHRYYTLRVCKECRADWMQAIKVWFGRVKPERTGCGSGIFVRRNGALEEITEAEWYAENPGIEPFRAK